MQDLEPSPATSNSDARLEEWRVTAEKSIRQEPLKTAGIALGTGFLLSILPLGRIIGGILQMAFSLIRPALLVFGLIKLVEEFDRQKRS
ncbi:MAG TPA: hypothetical protein VF593_04615 [Chthoniobacteraceae bacterium]|jgi:hypothetical protein